MKLTLIRFCMIGLMVAGFPTARAADMSAANTPAVGQSAPEIVGKDADGKELKLSDYRGKVVVLDFWGRW